MGMERVEVTTTGVEEVHQMVEQEEVSNRDILLDKVETGGVGLLLTQVVTADLVESR